MTYNVLSSHLCSPKQWKKCPERDLHPPTRLLRIQKKLADAMERHAVIGLQEVSSDWAGELHVFFAKHGYQTVFARYGESFNGYMGSLLAYPADCLQAEQVKLHHVGESLPPTSRDPSSWPQHLSPFGIYSHQGFAELMGVDAEGLKPNARRSPRGEMLDVLNPRRNREWALAARRDNVAVIARFKPLDGSSADFCVGVYHMPCLFANTEDNQTKNIHTLALRAEMAKFSNGDPCILLGDFNFRPASSSYSLITGAGLGHDEAPDKVEYRRLLTSNFPLQSAYVEVNGSEPNSFTLDYIWMSRGCEATACPCVIKTQRPSETEPSDHPLVEATIRLPSQLGYEASHRV